MKGPESRLRNKIKKALEAQYPQGLIFHVHGTQFQSAGIPDLLCIINGCFIGIEVKMPDKTPTPIQEFFIERINKAGGHATWITSVPDALSYVAKITNSL